MLWEFEALNKQNDNTIKVYVKSLGIYRNIIYAFLIILVLEVAVFSALALKYIGNINKTQLVAAPDTASQRRRARRWVFHRIKK